MKLRKAIVSVIALSAISTSALAEDVWLRAYPSSYELFTKQRIAANAHFKFKMYNPTNERKTFTYSALLCAEQNEKNCITHTDAQPVGPKSWWAGEFDMATAVEYWRQGRYDLRARIVATGMEYVEHERHGVINVQER